MKMPWGKYRGHEIEELPSGYLRWLATECDNEEIAEEADEEWQHRERYNAHHYEEP